MKIILLFIMHFAYSQEKSFHSKGLMLGVSLFAANAIEEKKGDAKKEFDTNGVLGLNLGYHYVASEGSGFILSIRLQEANQITESGATVDFTNTVGAFNYTYSVPENAYFLIGINFTFISNVEGEAGSISKDFEDESGGLGYQIGVGYLFGKFNFELVWQLLELENERGHITEIFSPSEFSKMQGLLLNFNYIF